MEFKKLTPKQDTVITKVIESGILDDKEVKTLLSIVSKKRAVIKATPQDWHLAEVMYQKLSARTPLMKKPALNRWANQMYAIRVTDRIGYETILAVMNAVYSDSWWVEKGIITDPQVLRRHIKNLIIRFKIQKPTVEPPEDMFSQALPKTRIDYGTYEEEYVF